MIKAENDARMVSILKKEKEEEEALKPQRVPLDQRFKAKVHNFVYGDVSKASDVKK